MSSTTPTTAAHAAASTAEPQRLRTRRELSRMHAAEHRWALLFVAPPALLDGKRLRGPGVHASIRSL